jgi:hypothetical protein
LQTNQLCEGKIRILKCRFVEQKLELSWYFRRGQHREKRCYEFGHTLLCRPSLT